MKTYSIDDRMHEKLKEMLHELRTNNLEWTYFDDNGPTDRDMYQSSGPGGKWRRVVTERNCDWYQELCSMFPSDRNMKKPTHRYTGVFPRLPNGQLDFKKSMKHWGKSKTRMRGKFDTKIKRQDIVVVLEAMIRGRPTKSMYVEPILFLAGRHTAKSEARDEAEDAMYAVELARDVAEAKRFMFDSLDDYYAYLLSIKRDTQDF